MSLSTHVLDLTTGRPAAGIPITLEHLHTATWHTLTAATTDSNGRATGLLPQPLPPGTTLRLRFDTTAYLTEPTLYPYIEITFTLADSRHHHIPLLLAANGYTTYRGS